ncbi:MAG: glycerophosphodiester phosphodiesterase [Clostridia bacterium]|nr:glycerophosphodiester phosphodiesterase [Clostridia bacterium]
MAVFVIILAALAALYVFLALPRLPRRSIRHLEGFDYAHRGLWNDELPENSLAAFRSAVEHGFGIELDVQLTADDQLVVFHDNTLERMCGVPGKVTDKTLAELRTLRLNGTEHVIPTFDEVLDAVNGNVPLIVEIKSCKRLALLCRLVRERLAAYGGAYCVESFDPRAVKWLRKNAPEIIRGQLAYGPGRKKPTVLNVLLGSLIQNVLGRPDFIAYDSTSDRNPAMGLQRLLRPTLVCWTIHSQEEMDRQRSRYDLQIFDGFVPKR